MIHSQVSTSEPVEGKTDNVMDADKSNTTAPDSSEDNWDKPEQSEDAAKSPKENNGSDACNGEVPDSKQIDGEDTNITSSNGTTPMKKAKSK